MMDTLEASCENVWTPRPDSWEEAVYSYDEQCDNLRYSPTYKNDRRPSYRAREEQHGENNQHVTA